MSTTTRRKNGYTLYSELKAALVAGWSTVVAEFESASDPEWPTGELISEITEDMVQPVQLLEPNSDPLFAVARHAQEPDPGFIGGGGHHEWLFDILIFMSAAENGDETLKKIEHYMHVTYTALRDSLNVVGADRSYMDVRFVTSHPAIQHPDASGEQPIGGTLTIAVESEHII